MPLEVIENQHLVSGKQGTLRATEIHVIPNTAADANWDQLLEAWKDIAAYLRRDIRTVQRWEKSLGLPIHRFQDSRSGRVFAYKRELESWRDKRASLIDCQQGPAPAPTQKTEPDTAGEAQTRVRKLWAAALIGAGFGAAGSALFVLVLKHLV